MTPNRIHFQAAIEDFQAARRRAALQEVLARVTGKSSRLLSYDDVAEKLKLRARVERGVRSIPLEAIVGSVGRYSDFTRTFLPRRAEDQQRWARVKAASTDPTGPGLPPIEVYKVGDVYFVVDGNHRVSIARQEGQETIEARVIEFRTDVRLTPDVQVDDLIIKSEYADFLRATRLADTRPNVDLTVTACCQYEKLMEQIELYRGEGVALQEAAGQWYDEVYIPLAEAIRDRGLPELFPGRTLTDMYLWISENLAELQNDEGWEIQSNVTATDLLLDKEDQKSESGAWRKARTVNRYTDHLFMDILVPLNGEPESWDALDQAIVLAGREQARLHGLHIVDSKDKLESDFALEVQARFNARCESAGVDGKLLLEQGEITKSIYERARMTDLIILKISHPPSGALSALTSPFRTIITNSSRPLLAVPQNASEFKRAVLAFDGSLLAREALFVAAYLAEIWKTELVVFTATQGGRVSPETQEYVHRYLEVHEVEAEYVLEDGDPAEGLLACVRAQHADLVLMGGYSGSALRGVVIGSSLDYILRESPVPIFICR